MRWLLARQVSTGEKKTAKGISDMISISGVSGRPVLNSAATFINHLRIFASTEIASDGANCAG